MKNPYKLLKELNIPVAYMKFEEETEIPFLIYYGSGSNHFIADNKIYNSDYVYRVEYYNNKKDEKIEREIEKLFNDNEIIWNKSEDIFIENENMFVIYYEIRRMNDE